MGQSTGNVNLEKREKTILSQTVDNSDDAIDLFELFRTYVSKWNIILLVTIIGMVLGNIISYYFITPKYESTAKLYVVSSSGDSVVDLTDLNLGSSLTNDYRELIYSYPVLDQVISYMKLDMTSKELGGLITLDNPTNTRILSITAKTPDPKLSMDIANTVAGVAQNYLPETMGTIKPNIAQVAQLPTEMSEPSYITYTLLGGIIAMMITLAIIAIRFVQDDTLKTALDIEKAFGFTPIACIYETKSMNYHDERISRKRQKTVKNQRENHR